MGMISDAQIEKVRESSDIVEVIGSFVKLMKRGHNYVALCPFHSEDTPSFNVSPDKQFYHCFGCGQGGNVITFVMNHEKMGFVEAIRYLADRAGIVIKEKSPADSAAPDVKDRICYANKIALEYFVKSLSGTSGIKAVNYLKSRKITSAVCKEFSIGYTPDKPDGLIRFASEKGISPEVLTAAGLSSKFDNGYCDFFRGRLMFPISNLSGRVVAFAGRALREQEPSKYINTPDTPIYHKGSQLFGLNLTKDHIKRQKRALVVEGYTDFISLYSSGIKYVVCSSGTAFTSSQASLLSRFTDNVVTLFDGDAAGLNAAERSVGELLSKGVEVLICLLPEGEDPDSFVKSKGAEELENFVANAVSYPQFKKMTIGKSLRQLSVMEREKLVQEIGGVINRIGDPLRKKLFTDQVEAIFDFPISSFLNTNPKEKRKLEELEGGVSNRVMLEREFLSLLAQSGSRIAEVSQAIAVECFTDPGCRIVYEKMIEEYSRLGSLELGKWIKMNVDPRITETLAGMDKVRWAMMPAAEIFEDYVKRFRNDQNKTLLRDIKDEIVAAEKQGDALKASDLQKRYLRKTHN